MPKGEQLIGGPGGGGGGTTHRVNGINSHIEDSFHNAKDPTTIITYEKPWHRLAVFMAATGKTPTEIAMKLNKSLPQVSDVLKQPHAQERMLSEMRTQGRDTLHDILSHYGPETLLEVVDLGKSAKSEQVQLAAKRELLDRWLGKPNQPFTDESKPAEQKTEDELRASVNTILGGLGRPEGVPDQTGG